MSGSGVPAAGDSKTQFADTHSIDIHAPNPGNPVFTCDKQSSADTPTLVTIPKTQEPLNKRQHPMYVTTTNTYGALQPTVETTPTSFHGKSQRFSEHLGQSGMYRNHSLNTAMDHSKA